MNCVVSEENPGVSEMRRRLDEFYASTVVYDDFKAPTSKPEFWNPIRNAVAETLAQHERCTVLEFGAGCTTFGDFLGELRSGVTFHVQDVTPQNLEHLRRQADEVHVGDLAEIQLNGRFDVIFSTFVWEHVSHPRATLEHLVRLLAPGGRLFLASPRYDAPFYVPPSARHYSRGRQLTLSAWLAMKRLMTMLGGRPQFMVHTDPAVFHRPWFRDADAVHWVSLYDLHRALPSGFRLKRIRIPSSGGWKRWVWARALLLFVEITKPVARQMTAE